jgi:hypothetical protein
MKKYLAFLACFIMAITTYAQDISFRLVEQTILHSFADSAIAHTFGGISAIEWVDKDLLQPGTAATHKQGLPDKAFILVTDHSLNLPGGMSYCYWMDSKEQVYKADTIYGLKNVESFRYNSKLKTIFYSFEDDLSTGVGFIEKVNLNKQPLKILYEEQDTTRISYNRGIEGITFDGNNNLWISFEAGGSTDCDGKPLRFYRIQPNANGRYAIKDTVAYQYPFDRCNCLQHPPQSFNGRLGNGVSEILAMKNDPDKLLALERCYNDAHTSVKLYLLTIENGSTLLRKQLVFDFKDTTPFLPKDKSFLPDNLEGMAWGPDENGHQMLYLVSDDNFSTVKKNHRQTNQLIKLQMITAAKATK